MEEHANDCFVAALVGGIATAEVLEDQAYTVSSFAATVDREEERIPEAVHHLRVQVVMDFD